MILIKVPCTRDQVNGRINNFDNSTSYATDTADIIINEFEFFSYTDNFKYLGTIFTPSLKDDLDIRCRINQANGAFAIMKQVLCDKKIPAKIQVRLYDAN